MYSCHWRFYDALPAAIIKSRVIITRDMFPLVVGQWRLVTPILNITIHN